jgi:hypothetical protein
VKMKKQTLVVSMIIGLILMATMPMLSSAAYKGVDTKTPSIAALPKSTSVPILISSKTGSVPILISPKIGAVPILTPKNATQLPILTPGDEYPPISALPYPKSAVPPVLAFFG